MGTSPDVFTSGVFYSSQRAKEYLKKNQNKFGKFKNRLYLYILKQNKMELKEFKNEELLKELKSRGFITDLLLSINDVDIAIDELEGDLIEEIKEKITFEKKLEIINSINTDDIGDKILDDIIYKLLEEFGNSK